MDEKVVGKTPMSVSVVFYILGVATLLPWNFFITAETYWQYKLRNTTLGDNWDASNATLTPLQVSFTPTLVIISNVVATLSFVITSAIIRRVTEKVRLYGSMVLSLLAMLIVTVLTFIDSDEWQTGFFVITMVIVALLNICMAVVQGSSSGLAGMFTATCMTSMVSGQAIAGVFSSLARIVSLGVGEEPIMSGLIYFLIADIFLVITIASYFYLTRTDFYAKVKEELAKKAPEENLEAKSDFKVYWGVLKKIRLMGMTVALVLLVTLAVFPAVVVYITSTLPESTWTKVYFQPTITFLLFNVGDWVGREVPRWIKWPGPEGWLLHILGFARVVFIPLLLLCYGDNKTFPTIFNHDAYYIIINTLFSFTNGYIITLTFIYYPTLVESGEREIGGAIMVALLGVGLVVGSLLSPALVALWGPV